MKFIFLVTIAIMFLNSSDFKIDNNITMINIKNYKYSSAFALGDVLKIFKSKEYLNSKYRKKSRVVELSKKYNNIVEFVKSEEFHKKYKNIFRADKCIQKINTIGMIYNKNRAIVEIDGTDSGNVFSFFIIYLKNKKLYSCYIECEVVHVAPVAPIN